MPSIIAAVICLLTLVLSFFYPAAADTVISPFRGAILGLVEGITEYLPISSTGHLVLADHFFLKFTQTTLTTAQTDAVNAYEIVIQSGAILAVLLLYAERVKQMVLGLLGKSPTGLRLFLNLVAAFLPVTLVGLILHDLVNTYLQSVWPVIGALAVGGVVMLSFERTAFSQRIRAHGQGIDELDLKRAFLIGCFQCIAVWPGTSRSFATIMGAMLAGLNPVAAAEFSFLLGLPTLLAATAYKILKAGPELVQYVGYPAMLTGMIVAATSAFIAVRGFVHFLNRKGLSVFGWYRIIIAIAMAVVFSS